MGSLRVLHLRIIFCDEIFVLVFFTVLQEIFWSCSKKFCSCSCITEAVSNSTALQGSSSLGEPVTFSSERVWNKNFLYYSKLRSLNDLIWTFKEPSRNCFFSRMYLFLIGLFFVPTDPIHTHTLRKQGSSWVL